MKKQCIYILCAVLVSILLARAGELALDSVLTCTSVTNQTVTLARGRALSVSSVLFHWQTLGAYTSMVYVAKDAVTNLVYQTTTFVNGGTNGQDMVWLPATKVWVKGQGKVEVSAQGATTGNVCYVTVDLETGE